MKCHEILIAQGFGPNFALAFTCAFALALALAEALGVALESLRGRGLKCLLGPSDSRKLDPCDSQMRYITYIINALQYIYIYLYVCQLYVNYVLLSSETNKQFTT